MQPHQNLFSPVWKLGALGLLAVVMAGIFMMLPNPVPRLSSDGVPPSWESVQTALLDQEASWSNILAWITSGEILLAEQVLDQEHRPIWAAAQAHYPDRKMPTGLVIANWVQSREQDITNLYHQHFSQAVSRVASGDLALDQLEKWLDKRNDADLLDILEKSWEPLKEKRILAATNWYRVVFQNPDESLVNSASMENLVRKAARQPDFIKLVFGPAMSDEEQAATYNTLLITGQVQTASFTAELNNSFKEQTWKPSPMVIGCSLYPRELRKDRPTQWADLEAVHAWMNPPGKISRSLEQQIQKSYRQKIQNRIRQEIISWPALKRNSGSKD